MSETRTEKDMALTPAENLTDTLSRQEEFLDSEQPATPPAEDSQITELREKVETFSREMEKWRDQALRLAAELENYRRRVQRDLPQQLLAAQGEILRALLPVIDSIERGLESAQKAPDIEKLKEGLRLTHHQLLKTLEKLEVQVIRPAIGDLPDPEKHEVLSTQITPDSSGNPAILEVVEPGYLYKGLLLRPARIIVSG